jgi:hypothetical protein
MELIDKLNAGAQHAIARARESVHETQLKRELADAYADLGRRTFALLQQRSITDERLASPASRIHDLEAQLAALTPADIPRRDR